MTEESQMKEPWEMTKEEYLNSVQEQIKANALDQTPREHWNDPKWLEDSMKWRTEMMGNAHKQYIRQMVNEGKPVPAEVLKDYPELAKVLPEVTKSTEKFVPVRIIKDTEKTTQYAGGKVKFGYNEYVVWPDGEKTLLSKEKAASGTLYRTEGRYADPQMPDISATSRDLLRDKVSRRYSELVAEPILVEVVEEKPEMQSYPRRIGGIKPRHYPSAGGLLE